MAELRTLARESAQPAIKSAAVVTAAGGLIVSLAGAASAEPSTVEVSTTVADAVASVTAQGPAVVGPKAGTTEVDSALAAVGFTAATKKAAAAPKAVVIKDVIAEQVAAKKAAAAKVAAAKKAAAVRAAATKAAAAKAVAAKRSTAERASRTTTSRRSLTNSTATTKATVNSAPRASSGARSGYNWATRGQCTWGALSMWYQSEGYYPGGFTGNALTWGYGAANAGYSVGSTPRTRSILVMQPGVHGSSSAGHVAWVTAVNGNQVTIVEMNALAGAYNYNTRTLTNTGGMRYIYAP